jgi:hypothetical protein
MRTVAYAYPSTGCSLMTPQTEALNCTTCISLKSQKKGYRDTKVKTRPIFLSSTLSRAIRFSSGPSDSRLVVTVNCHRSTHVNQRCIGPTSLTCCDSFAYSHKTFASSWERLACDSYGFASNMPTAALDMIVKPTKDSRDSVLRSCETRAACKYSVLVLVLCQGGAMARRPNLDCIKPLPAENKGSIVSDIDCEGYGRPLFHRRVIQDPY